MFPTFVKKKKRHPLAEEGWSRGEKKLYCISDHRLNIKTNFMGSRMIRGVLALDVP